MARVYSTMQCNDDGNPSCPQGYQFSADGGETWKELKADWSPLGKSPKTIRIEHPITLDPGTYTWLIRSYNDTSYSEPTEHTFTLKRVDPPVDVRFQI